MRGTRRVSSTLLNPTRSVCYPKTSRLPILPTPTPSIKSASLSHLRNAISRPTPQSKLFPRAAPILIRGVSRSATSTIVSQIATKAKIQSRGVQEAVVEVVVQPEGQTAIRNWLLGCATLVFGMVSLGGLTRLTESGLSIVDWKPVTGTIPPGSREEWEAEFEKYKQFPEYKKLNPNMNLDEFKQIFFMEWGHRQLGRFIGLSFALPLAYFSMKGYVKGPLAAKLGAILLGIGAQGALGWYMVKSGLEEDLDHPRVSQYRLAAHLGSAFLLYAGMIWTALDLTPVAVDRGALTAMQQSKGWPMFRRASKLTALLVFTTAMSGAFVAGLDAGLIYNEFPYMGKGLMPEEAFQKQPLWKNFFEDEASVQFDHRVLATVTLASVFGTWALSRRVPLTPEVRRAVNHLGAMGVIQYTLGIATILSIVQTHVAASHQAGSLLLLTFAVWLVHSLRRAKLLRK